MIFLYSASCLAILGSAFFWYQIYRKGHYEFAAKANRWITIGFLIGLLSLLASEKKESELIYFVFFLGLSAATSFSLSLFAEENQFQRWNIIFAQLLLLAAALLSGLELIFSSL